MQMTRRTFLKLAGAAALTGSGGLIYCSAEPYWLHRAKQPIRLKKPLLQNLRILHVTDLHIGNRQQFDFAEKALLDGLSHPPDLICITGDFINRQLYAPAQCRALFSKLTARVPVFACLGNHDGGDWVGKRGGYPDLHTVSRLLSDSGITVLRNEHQTISLHGQSVTLIGLDDVWSGTLDVEQGFRHLPSVDTPRIVLAHNPDMKEALKNHPWDLLLCGHTHGGQVEIPWVGAPVLPVKDRRFIHGLYGWENRQLHISSGVGTSCGVRFNCPPEICHLELEGVA